VVGLVASVGSAYLNLHEAPLAQRQLRSVALRSALYKLDSPVEPRTFTNDFPGWVIYVRDGDKTKGQWGRVFIQTQEPDHSVNLITARAGRIDSSAETSELVLQDAMKTRVPAPDARDQSYVVERLAQLRILFNTGRSVLLEKLEKPEPDPEQMGMRDLWRYGVQTTGVDRRDAKMTFHKRLAFSIAPFVFSLFGSTLAFRIRRGSRGFGILVSLGVLVVYYLLTIAGEQSARAGTVPAALGAWFSTSVVLALGVVLLIFNRQASRVPFRRTRLLAQSLSKSQRTKSVLRRRFRPRLVLASFPTLLDVSVIRTMLVSFVLAFIALVLIFDVFTTFELWRFISTNRASVKLVAEYLFYLLPLVSIELFPGSVLVAVLITYALIARRREAVAWWASGQSVYRLMLPGIVFAIAVATGAWFIQERVMPAANIKQDNLRARIRGNVAQIAAGSGRHWLVSADGSRIYAYDFDESRQVLLNPTIYEFDGQQIELRRVINGAEGKWLNGNQFEVSKAQWINLNQPTVARESAEALRINNVDPPSTFKPTVDRPSQLDAKGLRNYIRVLRARGAETAALTVALQRKYAGPFTVLVMALIGMPLAIWFGRKSTVVALASAVIVSLGFWLLSGGFQQLGDHGLLPPGPAIWTPIVIFMCGGLYLVSKVRT
jgi:lipopolysaccharide export system permease protein